MNYLRTILSIYRVLIYGIFGRETKGVMQKGTHCVVEEYEYEIYRGDIIHPCIRYTEKGFRGYNWWMVYTPYFNADASLENPILCYGISKDKEPPIEWNFELLVRGTPKFGYNSDPTMFFENDNLAILWRENSTPRTNDDRIKRATYGIVFSELSHKEITLPILFEDQPNIDKQVSPTIIKHNGTYKAYASHFRFRLDILHSKNKLINNVKNKFFWVLSLLEMYQVKKSRGIALWESSSLQSTFNYIKTIRIKNCNVLYQPWHFDFFEYDNKLFAIIQTNQFNANICLAVSDDYESFRMFSKPLITPESIKMTGIYKPSGIVHNETFYLYYTAQDYDNRNKNKMYRTKCSMRELLDCLND